MSNMGDGNVACFSAMVDEVAENGTIDGYLVNDALVRIDEAALAFGRCVGQTKLVGVMDLNVPLIITNKTRMIKFMFNVTGMGLGINSCGDGTICAIESGPFGGKFEVIN
jgi:hypothetical protein